MDAREAGFKVLSSSRQMRANSRFLAEYVKIAGGLCKVVADADIRRILGIHLLGGTCSEMIHSESAYIEADLRVQDVREIIFPHPTISEVIKEVCTAIDITRNQSRTTA